MSAQDDFFEILDDLLVHRSIDDISASEIVGLAGSTRTTFYRNNMDKYDLLNKRYDRIRSSAVDALLEGKEFIFTQRLFLQESESIGGQLLNALDSNDPNSLSIYMKTTAFDVFTERIKRLHGYDLSLHERLLLKTYISGIYEIYLEYLTAGSPESWDIASIIEDAMPQRIREIID